ncbi:hypothetical protein V8F20_009502 [Naviculisporaceae sp. PSN 640]
MEQQPQSQTRRQRGQSQRSEVDEQKNDNPVLQRAPSSDEEADQGQRALSRRPQQNEGRMLPASERRQLRRQQQGAGEKAVTQTDNGRGGAPALRLDMDLDIDIKMKAKIQGDVTLSLLEDGQR